MCRIYKKLENIGKKEKKRKEREEKIEKKRNVKQNRKKDMSAGRAWQLWVTADMRCFSSSSHRYLR